MAPSPHVRSDSEARTPSSKRVWTVVGMILAVSLAAVAGGLWYTRAAPESVVAASPKAPMVHVVAARRGSIPLVGEYRGELVAEAAELAARSSGRLLTVRGQLGDTFEKGELLAQVDALEPQRQLAEARAQVQAAVAAEQRVDAQLAAAKVELERGERLRAESLLSEQELTALRSQVSVLEAELNAAKAQQASARARTALFREQIADARLIAPFDGAISERYLDAGSSVQPGTPVLRLVRGGPLRARFRVPERDLRHIESGSEVRITTQATASKSFVGKLTHVSAEVSRTDRTLAAEALLSEQYAVLRPGMYANVSLTFGNLDDVTLVPSAAISERIGELGAPETILFVVEGETARQKVVTLLGRHRDDSAVEGVEPGALVVSFGHETLRDGGPVRIAKETSP